MLDKIAKEQFQMCREQLKENFIFRRLVRQNSLMKSLHKEVRAAFASTSLRRSFCLGLCAMDVDLDLFNLNWFDRKRSVYSYRDGTIGNMDFLMGERWDVCCKGDQTKFVTQLLIWLRDGNLHGTVHVAFALEGSRTQLQRSSGEAHHGNQAASIG